MRLRFLSACLSRCELRWSCNIYRIKTNFSRELIYSAEAPLTPLRKTGTAKHPSERSFLRYILRKRYPSSSTTLSRRLDFSSLAIKFELHDYRATALESTTSSSMTSAARLYTCMGPNSTQNRMRDSRFTQFFVIYCNHFVAVWLRLPGAVTIVSV